jgi:hypothetical protein
MATNKLPKILIAVLFLLFTQISSATNLEKQLQTLLTEKGVAAKVLAEKDAEVKAAMDEIAAQQAKQNAAVNAAGPSKTAEDVMQDAKITALEAGVQDNDKLNGDVLKFYTRASPFKSILSGKSFCAPKGAKAKVKGQDKAGNVSVRFKTLGSGSCKDLDKKCPASKEKPTDNASHCENVRKGEQYTISRAALDQFDFKRRGIVYGGLVVPFKYYLGGDKRISASSTVAPYLGVRGLGHFWGLHLTPIVSAGLGLVPVNKMTTGEDGMVSTSSDTKSALSFATGLVLTHEKNKAFTAGILFGKDFLSTEDRLSDPTVDKIWTSLYIGLTVGGNK